MHVNHVSIGIRILQIKLPYSTKFFYDKTFRLTKFSSPRKSFVNFVQYLSDNVYDLTYAMCQVWMWNCHTHLLDLLVISAFSKHFNECKSTRQKIIQPYKHCLEISERYCFQNPAKTISLVKKWIIISEEKERSRLCKRLEKSSVTNFCYLCNDHILHQVSLNTWYQLNMSTLFISTLKF